MRRASPKPSAPERLYLATAEAGDAEMADRIARHRDARGAGWTTREEPLDLVEALAAEARPGRIVLVDCLTLWLANLMASGRDVEAETIRLARALGALGGPAIVVSNEVGLGLVPETRLGRDFRDCQGRANAALARASRRRRVPRRRAADAAEARAAARLAALLNRFSLTRAPE